MGPRPSNAILARQPLFDRKLRVVGYELLYRGPSLEQAQVTDQTAATNSVVLSAMSEIGLAKVVGNRRAWVNVPRDFLLGEHSELLPPELVGLEILEDQRVDEPLLDAVRALKARGYRLALDDFTYRSGSDPLLELVDVVKLDLMALGRDGLAEHVRRLRRPGLQLLAEKVETREDHRFCADLGCDLFQGYFYCRPELVSDRRPDATRSALLRLLSALQDPGLALEGAEQLIAHDVSLSLRLLRYINSAYFGLRGEVASIRQALVLLGLENLRRWATLTVLAAVPGKPPELTATALVRARFCELAGALGATEASPGQLFTLGLFSVVDALLDSPIEVVLETVPFPDAMRRALVGHLGVMGALLECVIALERGAFDRVERLLPEAGEVYLEALGWADEVGRELLAPV